MSIDDKTERALRVLLDKQEIHEVLMRYCRGIDRCDSELLHSVYHRPNGWDHVPRGRKVPCGESSMWGDYHALELALLIKRLAEGRYLTFF